MAFNTEDTVNLIPLPTWSDEWVKNTPYLFRGLGIVIEFLAGDIRSKTTPTGIVISGQMPTAYGFILRTTDVHGEEIDMYLASMPDETTPIFVIDQVNPETGLFDEHKVMLGFSSIDEVVVTYDSVFSDGSAARRLGAITTFPQDTFKNWVGTEGYSLQPASRYSLDGVTTQMFAGIKAPASSPMAQPKPLDAGGGVVIPLPDLSKGPKLKTSAKDEGVMEYHLSLFSALDTDVWSNTIDTFCRALDLAKATDVVHIRIASPGGSVFLMGRIVSAMESTKAKVITYAQGCVASAATTVWAAGDERHILRGAYFMQHMSSQMLNGKSSDIAAKSNFCVEYISRQLNPLLTMGLFNDKEISDMITKSSDIYISGREAIKRVGEISYRTQEGV